MSSTKKRKTVSASAAVSSDYELHVKGNVHLDADGHVRSAHAKKEWRGNELHLENPLRSGSVSIIDGVRIRGSTSMSFGPNGARVNGMPLAEFMRKQADEERRIERELRVIDEDVSTRHLRRVVVSNGTFESRSNDVINELVIEARNNADVKVRVRQLPSRTRVEARNNSDVTIDLVGNE